MSAGQTAKVESRLTNLVVRFAAGIPTLVLIVVAVAYAPWWALSLLTLAAALYGMVEFRTMLAGRPGTALPLIPLLASTVLIHLGALVAGAVGLHAMLVIVTLLWMAVCLLTGGGDHARIVMRLGLGIFGFIWIGWFLAHWTLIFQVFDGSRWGIYLLLTLTGSDIMAYCVGCSIGRHPLLPAISPRKTVEGLLGALLGGMLGGALAALWLPWFQLQVSPLKLMLLCVVLALVAQLGDLVASVIKRRAGVKDSGRFLPGHGGFLDRLDSLLLAPAPLYYAITLGFI